MNENTTYNEVFDSFESSFSDKKVIPESLEIMWLLKAVARYSTELEVLNFDSEIQEFDGKLDQYVIDTLAAMMHEMYQKRQKSKVNKIASIVGGDLSINGTNGLQKYTKQEYDDIQSETSSMIEHQKTTAYI